MKRLYSVLSTVMILCGLLYVYCIVLVPVLEPVSQYVSRESDPRENDLEIQQLKSLFSKNAWELEPTTRHIAIGNIHLFVEKDTISPTGEIKVNRCSLIAVSNDSSLRINERYKSSLIVQCLGETTMRFERSILQQGMEGSNEFIGGFFSGEIHIRCAGDLNTKEDDLNITTRDVHINSERAWTTANIIFSYGRSHGIGTGLQIQFINSKMFNNSIGQNNGIMGGGLRIDKILLQKLQSLTFYQPHKKGEQYEPFGLNDPNVPCTIQCDGNFIFNVLSKCATFNDNVRIMRQVPEKEPETIVCDLLNLQFTSETKENSLSIKDKQTNESSEDSGEIITPSEWNLTLKYVEAIGNTVELQAPSYLLSISTSRLMARLIPEPSYVVDSSGADQSRICYSNYEIRTNNITYTEIKDSPLGHVESNSNGCVISKLNPSQMISARWSDQLEVTINPKDKTEHKLSLKGNAHLDFTKNSQNEASIASDNIYFWIKLTQKDSNISGGNPSIIPNNSEFQIQRVMATSNVNVTSPVLTGKLNTLQLWIESQAKENNVSGNQTEISLSGSDQGFNFLSANSDENNSLTARYFVTGDTLQGKVISGSKGYTISELNLKKDICVTMTNLSTEDSPQLEMTGTQIEMHDVTKPTATAKLIGELAQVKYGNMFLTGSAINVNRGTNTIWMDGTGQITINSNVSTENKNVEVALIPSQPNNLPTPDNQPNAQNTALETPVSKPIVSKIQWDRSMKLQGDEITFSGNIVLDRENVYGQCENMAVQLTKKVDLQNPQSDLNLAGKTPQSIQIRTITLSNSVKLENSTYQQTQKVAQDTLFASTLTINMLAETFQAFGPGRAMTQRKLHPISISKISQSISSDQKSTLQNNSANTADEPRLMHVCVDFQKEFTGTINTTKPMTFNFNGHIEGVYGPIDNIGEVYENYDMTKAPEDTITLRCEKMQITTASNSLDQKNGLLEMSQNNMESQISKNFDFVASSGVSFESLMYSINAETITYESKNNLMKIEGDGQIPAKFFYQKVPDGRYHQASSSTIYYNTKTGSVRGEGMQDFTLFMQQNNNEDEKK